MNESASNRPDALFPQFVMMFSATAMQHLGKLVNPATGKTEVDLEGAQFAIDMLEMLEARTRGNLSDEEQRLLGTTLTELRLNYVDVRKSAPSKPEPEPEPVSGSDAAAESETAGEAAAPPVKPPTEDRDPPRFHKTYG